MMILENPEENLVSGPEFVMPFSTDLENLRPAQCNEVRVPDTKPNYPTVYQYIDSGSTFYND